ncbi:MAG: HU family DNA-binding protein [Paludibacteraceae bacterium]
MSNTKLSVQEIVELMVKDRMITKKSAEEFVKVFFSTIEDTLIDGEIVKVKGLGTFKSQWNEARKSVDVNTGEEIIIDGYYRASFVPENELKELINEPFAHLEPVELEPATDKSPDENIVAQSEEEKNSENESPEPIRIFEEQAEEIKGLLSEINALSPKMSEPVLSKTDVDLQAVPLKEKAPGDNVITEENNEQIGEKELQSEEPENHRDQNRETIIPSDVATLDSNHIINSETEFDLNDFDIVRDISTRSKAESADSESVNVEPEEPKQSEIIGEQADKGIDDKSVKDEPVAGVADVAGTEDFSDINENDLEPDSVAGPDVDDETETAAEEEEETEDDDIDDELNEDTIYVEDNDDEEVKEFEDENDNLTDDIENDNEEVNPEINIERKNTVFQNEPSIDDIPPAEDKTNLISKRDLQSSIYDEKEANDAETAVTAENTPTGEQPEKKKRPVWLYSALGIVVLAGLTWFAFSFIKKDIDEKKNRKYMEYLADSTVNALKIKQAADYQKVDSAKTDSVETQPVKIPPKTVQQTESVSGNVFNVPRNYARLISTEKIVIGSKLTKFAQHYYGNSNFWVYIFEANRDLISDPDNVPLGITIKIPELDPRLADPGSKESIDYAKKLQSKYLK